MAKLTDELKQAISLMPSEEKNKLLYRLIAKDEALTAKLTFQLLENTQDDIEERAKVIEQMIYENIPARGSYYLTPGLLMMDMRGINAQITKHVKVTKDKFGEVNLTIILLLEAFQRHHGMLNKFTRNRSVTFVRYVIQRLKFIFKKIEKLDSDYYIEIEENLNKVLTHVYAFEYTSNAAKKEEIPNRWSY